MQYDLSVTGGPTGGSFTLRIETGAVGSGQTYDGTIPFNATAAQVKAAIEAMPNMKDGSVAASGGPLPGTPVVLLFAGMGKGTPRKVTIGTNSLTGGTTPAPAIAENTAVRHDRPGRNDAGFVQTRAAAGAWGN